MIADDQTPAHGINVAALAGEAILRALAGRDPATPFATAAELADAAGRPRKNIHRELDQLKNAHLVGEGLALSADALYDAGRSALAALDRAAGAGGSGLLRVPADRLLPNPLNPRRTFDPDALESLADSFEADGDIIEPLVVSPPDALDNRFIWAGHRRWRAAKLLAAREGGLPVALAQGLPCVEREADPTQALFIAVVENSQREDLSPWEDAQALLALAEGTNWSARELARRIGRSPNGSEAGVRDVQVKIKIAREAKPEAVADYERTRNWDRLRESVQAPATKPALELTPKLALALVELAHKAQQDPADLAEPGFTLLNAPQLSGGALSTLSERKLITTKGEGWQGTGYRYFYAKVLFHSSAAGQWLTDAGFPDHAASLLARLRTEVLGENIAVQLAGARRYATSELNLPTPDNLELAKELRTFLENGSPKPTAPITHAEPAQPEPSGKAVDPDARIELPPYERFLLIEIAHKVAHDPASVDQGDQRFAPVGKYWLDQAASNLQTARLILFKHAGAAGPQVSLTTAGAEWLKAEGVTLPVTDSRLSNEQGVAARRPESVAQVYATPWLTPEPAVVDQAAQDATEVDGGGEEDEAAAAMLEAAHDMAQKAAEDFGLVRGAALAELLAQTGAPGPWKLASEHQPGVILAADGSCACVVDVDNELPDDMATARALAIMLAVNAAAGLRALAEG